jgi:predicted transposase/invertase (TIGR01784 family)
MTDATNNTKMSNPHDKLFRETWSDLDNARSFLSHYLPEHVLEVVDLSSLEISKDSFIEMDLSDYYSDMLYRVNLSNGSAGLIYVLFEHKSYYDRYVHLQLLEYMIRIWRLHIKQHKKKPAVPLPIVIPLLICHGRREWPENSVRLVSLLSGPTEELAGYIPDFGFELYDLVQFSDDEIKGTILGRVTMLLLKYVFNPKLHQKLPEILSLLKTLMTKETGLQYLEAVIRYLASVLEEDEMSLEKLQEIATKAISTETGRYIMTLAEKLRKEGEIKGEIKGEIRGEIKGEIKGLKEAIELGMTLKFPEDVNQVMADIRRIHDVETLLKIKEAIITAKKGSEILALAKSEGI